MPPHPPGHPRASRCPRAPRSYCLYPAQSCLLLLFPSPSQCTVWVPPGGKPHPPASRRACVARRCLPQPPARRAPIPARGEVPLLGCYSSPFGRPLVFARSLRTFPAFGRAPGFTGIRTGGYSAAGSTCSPQVAGAPATPRRPTAQLSRRPRTPRGPSSPAARPGGGSARLHRDPASPGGGEAGSPGRPHGRRGPQECRRGAYPPSLRLRVSGQICPRGSLRTAGSSSEKCGCGSEVQLSGGLGGWPEKEPTVRTAPLRVLRGQGWARPGREAERTAPCGGLGPRPRRALSMVRGGAARPALPGSAPRSPPLHPLPGACSPTSRPLAPSASPAAGSRLSFFLLWVSPFVLWSPAGLSSLPPLASPPFSALLTLGSQNY